MKKLLTGTLAVLLLPYISFAAPSSLAPDGEVESTSTTAEDYRGAFKSLKEIPDTGIAVPTVVEVPLTVSETVTSRFGVYNSTQDQFEPYRYYSETEQNRTVIEVTSDDGGLYRNMYDRKSSTYESFPASLDGTIQETVFSITTAANTNVQATGIRFDFGSHVSYPLTVQVVAFPSQGIAVGEPFVAVSKKRFTSEALRFPKMSAQKWQVTLTHTQPLQIREVSLVEENIGTINERGVRFLAQPGDSYLLYYNSDRYENIPVGEMPNLSNDDVLELAYTSGISNPFFEESDYDNDGIPDKLDNCVRVANADQVDVNNNGRGDVCDDFDKDGVLNAVDNCPNEPNRSQRDEDGDDIGDECDGEESRLTEANPWIPWAGMGIALLVMVFLFASTMRKMKEQKEVSGAGSQSEGETTTKEVQESEEVVESTNQSD